MNSEIDGQMLLISQYYPPDVYSQLVVSHQQGPTENNNSKKPKRRRKKSKCDENASMRKRKLSEEQVNLLEQSFGDEHKLESERKDRLASELGLDPRQVAVWFQNRRARWKSKQLEEEYVRLKSEHETTVVEKCHLESELLKLKEKLGEAEKEIYRMSESRSVVDGFSSNSPRSSFSMEAIEPTAFLGMTNDLNNVIYNAPEINYVNGMEWDFYHYM